MVVSVVRALADGWRPVGDRAVIALRAIDVLTGESPLLGQPSASAGVTGQETHSLGPMLYWLLAVPARISPGALVLVAGAVAVFSIVATVALAHRRGGPGLALAVALGLTLVCGALPAETLHDVWNPYIAILPTGLLLFVAWSLACGEHRLLPAAVVLASFLAQAHLAYLLPAAGLMVVGVAGLWVWRRASVHREPLRRWVAGAAVAGLGCWSLPIVEQLVHRPGNVASVIRTATGRGTTLGSGDGWNAVVHAVGVPPWWLDAPTTTFDWLGDVGQRPTLGSMIVTLIVLAGLMAALIAGLRRRRADLTAAGAIGLVVCLGVFAVASGTPTKDGLYVSVGYTLWWSLPAAVVVWGMLAWALAGLAPRRPQGTSGAARPRQVRSTALAAAGVTIVALTGAVVGARLGEDPYQPAYDAVTEVLDTAIAGLPSGRFEIDTASPDVRRFDVEASLAYELRRRGVPFTARGGLANLLGNQYQPRDDGPFWTLRLASNGETPEGRGLVLADKVLPASEPSRTNVERPARVAIWLQP